MPKINVKVKKGGRLFRPGTRILIKEEETITVTENPFWRRRLKDGDVIKVKKLPSKRTNSNSNPSN